MGSPDAPPRTAHPRRTAGPLRARARGGETGIVDALAGHPAGHRHPPGPGLDARRCAYRHDPTEPAAGASADILAALRQRAPVSGPSWRPAPAGSGRRRRRAVGPGGPGHRHRRRLLGRSIAALHPPPVRGGPGACSTGGARTPAGPGRSGVGEGRWSLLPEPDMAIAGSPDGPPMEEMAEAVAWQLLARWGVVAWELWSRESFRVPWREVVRALRRLEARGQALGGRFVAGMAGEQYALPEAAALLADVRRDAEPGSGGGSGRRRSPQSDRSAVGRRPDPCHSPPQRPLPGWSPLRATLARSDRPFTLTPALQTTIDQPGIGSGRQPGTRSISPQAVTGLAAMAP